MPDGNITLKLGVKVDKKSTDSVVSDLNKSVSNAFTELTSSAKQASAAIDVATKKTTAYARTLEATKELEKMIRTGKENGQYVSDADIEAAKQLLEESKQLKEIKKEFSEPTYTDTTGAGYIGGYYEQGTAVLTGIDMPTPDDIQQQIAEITGEVQDTPIEVPATVDPESFAGMQERIKELQAMLKTGVGESGEILSLEQIQIAKTELDDLKTRVDSILNPPDPEVLISPFSRLRDVVTKTATDAMTLFGKIKGGFSKLGRVVSSFTKNSQKSFKHNLMTVLKYGLGVRGLFMAFRRLRSAALSAFKDMASQIPEVGATFNAFNQGLAQMKGSLGTVIAPIATALLPLFQQIVSVVTAAANAVANFFAVLTGQKAIYKATAAQKDYTGAVKGSTEAQKKSVMGFDELNKLQDDSAGGGGGGSGVDYAKEAVDMDTPLSRLAETVRNLWLDGKFEEAGIAVGDFVNNIIHSLDKLEGQPDRVFEFGKSIGEKLNSLNLALYGFIQTVDWSALGALLARGINGLFDGIDWYKLGRNLMAKVSILIQTIGSFIANFDWAAFANDLSRLAMGMLDELARAIKTLDGKAIGQAILDFLSNIDWNGLFVSFGSLVGAALRVLVDVGGVLWGVVQEACESLKNLFIEGFMNVFNTIPEDANLLQIGAWIISGILDGMLNVVATIGKWVYDNILKPFATAVCEAFGIASPSKVAMEWGEFIILGLFDGITSLVDKVVEIWNNLKTKITDVIVSLHTSLSAKLQALWDTFTNIFTSIRDGVAGIVRGMVNIVIGAINNMISGVVNGINAMFRAASFNINTPFGSIGLNLPQISAPQIPMLAKGAVIPPNAPFMAMLGDQSAGNNIEAPEDLIRKIVREESNSDSVIIAELLRELITMVGNIRVGDDTIGRAAARYQHGRNRATGVY